MNSERQKRKVWYLLHAGSSEERRPGSSMFETFNPSNVNLREPDSYITKAPKHLSWMLWWAMSECYIFSARCTVFLWQSKVLWAQYSDDKIVDYDEQQQRQGRDLIKLLSSYHLPVNLLRCVKPDNALLLPADLTTTRFRDLESSVGTLAKRYVCAARVFND